MFSFTHNNISYTLEIPNFPVSLFVDHYLFIKGNGMQIPERLFPNNKIELFFNLGDDIPGKSNWDASTPVLKDNIISGLRHTYFDFYPPANLRMAGIRFTLFGFFQLFKTPAYYFTDNNFSANDVWGKELQFLHERLFEVQEHKMIFGILNKWILERLSTCSLQEIKRWTKLEQMLLSPDFSVSALLNNYMGYSHKHSIQLIKTHSGFSPKDIKQIYRFDRVLKDISHAALHGWSGFAYDKNYADQSHFIREFKYFTGYTPNQYLKMKPREYYFHESMPAEFK